MHHVFVILKIGFGRGSEQLKMYKFAYADSRVVDQAIGKPFQRQRRLLRFREIPEMS